MIALDGGIDIRREYLVSDYLHKIRPRLPIEMLAECLQQLADDEW